MAENENAGRFKIVPAPVALPASCFTCSIHKNDYFIDLQIQMEFHGAVYLCSQCLAEMGRLAGFETPGEVKLLRRKIEALETENFELMRKTDGLRKAVDGLHSAGYGSISDPSSYSNVNDSLVTSTTSTGEKNLGVGEGEITEPLNDSGVEQLRSDADSDESEFKLDL